MMKNGSASVGAETPVWYQNCLIHPTAFDCIEMAWIARLGIAKVYPHERPFLDDCSQRLRTGVTDIALCEINRRDLGVGATNGEGLQKA